MNKLVAMAVKKVEEAERTAHKTEIVGWNRGIKLAAMRAKEAAERKLGREDSANEWAEKARKYEEETVRRSEVARYNVRAAKFALTVFERM